MLRRIFTTSTTLLVLAALGYAGFYFFIQKPSTQNPALTTALPTEDAALATVSGKLSAITSQPIISYTVHNDGAIYYITQSATQSLYQISTRGTNATKVAELGSGIVRAHWNAAKSHILLQFTNNAYTAFDTQTRQHTPIKSGVDDVVWAEQENRIIYKFFEESTKERSLNIADPDGNNWSKVAILPYRHAMFSPVPHTPLIAFWERPDGTKKSELTVVNIFSPSSTQRILGDVIGGDYSFSPDGQHILVSRLADPSTATLQLGVSNSRGGNYQNLNTPTLVSKTVWAKDNKTVYFAQPTNIPSETIMPNDYASGRVSTIDTFWKIDTTTGKKERIVDLEDLQQTFDATNLSLSPSGDALIFINKKDNLLYRIDLTQ